MRFNGARRIVRCRALIGILGISRRKVKAHGALRALRPVERHQAEIASFSLW
jgi:hypothetical protein